jgi:hypothetical protein
MMLIVVEVCKKAEKKKNIKWTELDNECSPSSLFSFWTHMHMKKKDYQAGVDEVY